MATGDARSAATSGIGRAVIDLHCHTTASDGTLSPPDLVARAVRDGADVIAVTDHDTVDGIEAAVRTGAELGVRIVAGIEVSSRHGERNVHMLGYFLDPASLELRAAMGRVREHRVVRAQQMVERLVELGYDVTMDDVAAQTGGEVIARPHVARALVAKGYVPSVKAAFSKEFLGDGGRADVPKQTLSSVDAIAVIRAAGGVAVIAHPGAVHHDGPEQGLSIELLDELCAAGLAGIEVDHPDHAPLVRDKLRAIAAERGLVVTGGSDFHGDEAHVLGRYRTSPDMLDRLEAAAT